jgi:GDP-L-fucose synthase
VTVEKGSKIYVAGHRGLVGAAIVRRLESEGYRNIVTRGHSELDLTRQADTESFFESEAPEYVFLVAAKVGGIGANSTYPAEFIYENLSIALNVIDSAYKSGVKKLLNLGSSCIYPKLAPQPMKEDYFLTGVLESTNEAYAIAKIAAINLCKHYNRQFGTNYISAMPTNMYGPGDNYDLERGHVLPVLIRKFHEAKISGNEVLLWGDGSPLREFLYSDDLGAACVFLMNEIDYAEIGDFINVGSGAELSIRELAAMIADVVGYTGPVRWDATKPNGTPRKLLDSSRLFSYGWKPRISLREGIELAYGDYLLQTKK